MALLKGHGTTHEVYYYQFDHLGSDDQWNEQEVLLKGPRIEGVEVFKP